MTKNDPKALFPYPKRSKPLIDEKRIKKLEEKVARLERKMKKLRRQLELKVDLCPAG